MLPREILLMQVLPNRVTTMKLNLIAIVLPVLTFVTGLVLAQQYPKWDSIQDGAVAQFAISHGHCNLVANANMDTIEIKSFEDDLSDIKIDFAIDMRSISSFSEEVTNELNSPEIFNTILFPSMYFNCIDNFKLGENWYQLRGDLTINGVTKYVRLMLTPERAGKKNDKQIYHFYINGNVNLFDFGIMYPGETTKTKTMFININLEQTN